MKFHRLVFLSSSICLGLTASCVAPSPKGEDDTDPTCDDCQPDPTQLCSSSSMGSPRLKRLTARELNATLTDVFPEASGMWSSALSADPISELGFDNQTDLLVVGKQKALEIDSTAKYVAQAVAGMIDKLLP